MGGLKREGARSEGQDFIKVHYQPDAQKHASRGAAAVCPSRAILAPDQAVQATELPSTMPRWLFLD